MIIKLLGFRRALLLAILVAINLILAGVYYGILTPIQEESQLKLSTVQSDIIRLQGDIDNLKSEKRFLEESLPRYQELGKNGFFDSQDRFFISKKLDELKSQTALSGFSFTVDDLKNIPNAEADAAGKKLIFSRITITKAVSLLDIDFYGLLQSLDQVFPTHVRINSFSVKKQGDVTDELIMRLSSGEKVTPYSADVEFEWITMVDKPQEATPGFQ